MFGNLFASSSKEMLDHQGWNNRQKRGRDEVSDGSGSEGEEGGFGGQRNKAGRVEELGEDHREEQSGMVNVSLGEGEGMEGVESASAGAEERRQMMLMMTAQEEVGEGEGDGEGMMGGAGGAGGEEGEGAEPTQLSVAEMVQTLMGAVAALRRQREQGGGGRVHVDAGAGGPMMGMMGVEEEESESEDLLAGPSSPSRRRSPFGFASASSSSAGGAADPVALAEQLLRGFKPLMQAGTRPVAQIQDLLQAMAASPLDKINDSAQQVASELHKLQGELSVRLPYRRGALARAADKSLASIKAGAMAAAAAEAGGGGGAGGGPAGVVPAEGARKPDEAFEAQMEACNEMVEQLRALDEAEARVEEYRRHYLERGQALVQDKDAWIKTWHAKLLDHSADAERAKQALLGLDQKFDALVRSPPTTTSTSTGTSPTPSMDLAGLYPAPTAASSSSLALVSRLLDITRSEQWRDLVAARGAAAETLEGKEKRRAKVATNLRLVEGFVSLMRVLADGGTALLARACAGFAEEVAGIRGKLQGELKGQVAGAASKLQALLEFHEARKMRASKSAKLREHELRQHTSLFGQDTPTETLRLEACVKELRRVVSHSQLAVEKAMQSHQAFFARVEEQFPSAIALDLAAAFRKQMAHPPALSSMPFPTTTTNNNNTEGGAAAGASSYATYSPLRGNKGPEGALSQAVAEGLVASEQEQQAASEESWGAKQSAGKRDEGCVVM